MITVTLTNRELAMAAECGIMRNVAAMVGHLKDANGFADDTGWSAHIEGACGEVAAAKAMGRFWSPTVNSFHAADIGRRLQIRTRSQHSYELIVRPNDNPEHLYVLVTGTAPAFAVRGYMLGNDARRDEWLRTHGSRPAAWFVPQDALQDIADLQIVKETA